jgi:hypothetical protein
MRLQNQLLNSTFTNQKLFGGNFNQNKTWIDEIDIKTRLGSCGTKQVLPKVESNPSPIKKGF